MSYFEATAADGPQVVAWLEAGGYIPDEPDATFPSLNRRLREWAAGAQAQVGAVDRLCIQLGVHPLELPDSVWVEHYAYGLPRAAKGRYGRLPVKVAE